MIPARPTTSRLPARRRRGAYTLVELMISLTIFGFASTAMSSLMFATFNTNRHVKNTTDASSQAEIAMRRMIEVTRSSVDLTYTSPSTGLFLQTPPDSNSLSYIFIYYTANGQLHEKIETAGSLTLIQDTIIVDAINSFSVTRLNAGTFPECYRIDLVLATTPVPISRSATVTGRNLTQ